MVDEWRRLTTVYWLIQTIADVAPDDEWLAPAERATLAALRYSKRRRDWRLGRWTVKRALARLTRGSGSAVDGLANFVVGRQPNGAPCSSVNGSAVPWPMSISHSHDRGLCAVGPAGTAVGCDLERVEPRVEDFTSEWFTPAEQDAIARTGAAERHQMVTLLWSAKESALKAIATGLTVSTLDVTVTVDGPERHGEWSALHVNRAGDPEPMLGWWRRDAEDLITVVTAPALGRPVAITAL